MTNLIVPSRDEIIIGQTVWGIEKKNYGNGQLTQGVVARILTSSPFHPRGIKVMFANGIVARVQSLWSEEYSKVADI